MSAATSCILVCGATSAIELHEKTDIRDFRTDEVFDIVVIDVSFISACGKFCRPWPGFGSKQTRIAAMVKPQFEAGA